VNGMIMSKSSLFRQARYAQIDEMVSRPPKRYYQGIEITPPSPETLAAIHKVFGLPLGLDEEEKYARIMGKK